VPLSTSPISPRDGSHPRVPHPWRDGALRLGSSRGSKGQPKKRDLVTTSSSASRAVSRLAPTKIDMRAGCKPRTSLRIGSRAAVNVHTISASSPLRAPSCTATVGTECRAERRAFSRSAKLCAFSGDRPHTRTVRRGAHVRYCLEMRDGPARPFRVLPGSPASARESARVATAPCRCGADRSYLRRIHDGPRADPSRNQKSTRPRCVTRDPLSIIGITTLVSCTDPRGSPRSPA